MACLIGGRPDSNNAKGVLCGAQRVTSIPGAVEDSIHPCPHSLKLLICYRLSLASPISWSALRHILLGTAELTRETGLEVDPDSM